MAPSEQMDTPSTPAAQCQSDASVPKVDFCLTFLTMLPNFVVYLRVVEADTCFKFVPIDYKVSVHVSGNDARTVAANTAEQDESVREEGGQTGCARVCAE